MILRVFSRIAMFAVLLGVAAPAAAQVQLWRDLSAGDSPEIVESKLAAMPEIKRVKTKVRGDIVREQDINMQDGGVPIFDGNFSVLTDYTGLSLTKVQLASGWGCSNSAFALASKIDTELSTKYWEILADFSDEFKFNMASLDATSSESTTLSSVYSNGETAVVMTVEFTRTDPPTYIGGSALARSLYQIARTTYENRAASCGGTGYLTAQIRLTYVSKSDFDAKMDEAKEDSDAERKEAADNL